MPNVRNEQKVAATAEKYGHGDYRTYNAGCRCFSCREASNVYSHEKRNRKLGRGALVDINSEKLTRAITEHGMVATEFAGHLGMSSGSMYTLINRGNCGFYTLDKMAVALGCHPIEFLADPEYVYGEVVACHG